MNPLRPFRLWHNNRIMRNGILPYILDGIRNQDRKGNKTMHSLAVKAYKNEHSAEEGEIDARWIDVAVDQFKMLLFAGHDTVSSTFCFVTALLHFHPEKLAKVRLELDQVLGSGSLGAREATIAQRPEILNQLTYLAAVIKETLRLFGPVGGTIRQANADQHIFHHETGEPLPLWDMMLFSHQAQLHRDETFWPRAHEFIPERFTAKEGDYMYPRKNTFRPFEMGSRNCIGQEFAMTELRLMLALVLQDFDFKPMYPHDGPKYFGTVLYQTCPPEDVIMHPKDGMPVKVFLRNEA